MSSLINTLLALHNGCYRLKSYIKINILTVTNAALYAATVVGFCGCFLPFDSAQGDKGVVQFGAFEINRIKTFSLLKTFYRINAQHSFSQVGMQFIKHRFA